MIEDVFEGIFRVIARFIGYIVVEIVFEILLKGSGYIILKPFCRHRPDMEGLAVIVVGALFWIIIIGLGYSFYTNIIAKLLAVM